MCVLCLFIIICEHHILKKQIIKKYINQPAQRTSLAKITFRPSRFLLADLHILGLRDFFSFFLILPGIRQQVSSHPHISRWLIGHLRRNDFNAISSIRLCMDSCTQRPPPNSRDYTATRLTTSARTHPYKITASHHRGRSNERERKQSSLGIRLECRHRSAWRRSCEFRCHLCW